MLLVQHISPLTNENMSSTRKPSIKKESKDFGRIESFEQYQKEVTKAISEARKTLGQELYADSTRVPRNASRISHTSRSLMEALQGILTRDYQDLNIQLKKGVNAIPQVVYKMGERTFYTDLMVPQERFNTRTYDSVLDRLQEIAKDSVLQDYEDQDGIHWNSKRRKDRLHFGLKEMGNKMKASYQAGRSLYESAAEVADDFEDTDPVSYASAPYRQAPETKGINPDTSKKGNEKQKKEIQKPVKDMKEGRYAILSVGDKFAEYVLRTTDPECDREIDEFLMDNPETGVVEYADVPPELSDELEMTRDGLDAYEIAEPFINPRLTSRAVEIFHEPGSMELDESTEETMPEPPFENPETVEEAPTEAYAMPIDESVEEPQFNVILSKMTGPEPEIEVMETFYLPGLLQLLDSRRWIGDFSRGKRIILTTNGKEEELVISPVSKFGSIPARIKQQILDRAFAWERSPMSESVAVFSDGFEPYARKLMMNPTEADIKEWLSRSPDFRIDFVESKALPAKVLERAFSEECDGYTCYQILKEYFGKKEQNSWETSSDFLKEAFKGPNMIPGRPDLDRL
jgi:hypothetical protein